MLEKYSLRRSLGAKSALNIILIAAILGGAVVASGFQVYKQSMEDQLIRTAGNLAVTVAEQVDANSISRYLESGQPDSEYWRTRERIAQIQRNNDISYILVIKPTEEGFYYIYDTDQRETAYWLGDFEPHVEGDGFYEQLDLFLAGKDVPPIISEFEGLGWYLSVCMPLKDAAGVTQAYVDVDMSMEQIKAMQRDFLTRLIRLLALIAMVLAVLSVLTARRMIVNPINRLAEATSEFVRRQQEGGGERQVVMDLPKLDTGDEVGRLYLCIRQMEADIYEYIDNLTAVTAEKERIGAELGIATQIQASMLPCIFPPFPDRREFDIFATMKPAKEVGGDFYDFFLVDEDHLALVIADVSGKGVPAALFMVIAKTLLKNDAQAGNSPGQVLEKVNGQLCENNEAGMFVTVWLGILEISTGKMVCANAGHEYPALCPAGGSFELLKDKHGFVLAGMEGARYKEYELELKPGDTLYVYTDGVSEATDAGNELFGTDRMLEALNGAPAAVPGELLPRVKEKIEAFVGEAPQFDDITMLGLRYCGNGGAVV